MIRKVFKDCQRGEAADLISLRRGRNWKVFQEREWFTLPPKKELQLEVLGKRYRCKLPLLGQYQDENLAVALAGLEVLSKKIRIKPAAILRGLRLAHWPGRMQVAKLRPLILIDGAHNPAGARLLAASLKSQAFPKVHAVLGMLRDKDWKGILNALESHVDEFHLCAPKNERALDPDVAAAYLRRRASGRLHAYASVATAIQGARKRASPSELILICGSLYVVGEALEALKIPVS